MIDNLDDDALRDLFRRVRQLETGSPLASSSVSRGAVRILSPEGLIVNGSARVTGVLNGDGTMTWTGTMNVDGPLNIDGATTATGDVTLNGKTVQNGNIDINGILDIDGSTGINGDLFVRGNAEVSSGGKITVAGAAPVTLGIASNGFPGLQFPGGNLTAGTSSVAMQSGNAAIGVSSGQASMVVDSVGLGVNSGGVSSLGRFNLDTAETVTGVTANCYVGADGRVRRIV